MRGHAFSTQCAAAWKWKKNQLLYFFIFTVGWISLDGAAFFICNSLCADGSIMRALRKCAGSVAFETGNPLWILHRGARTCASWVWSRPNGDSRSSSGSLRCILASALLGCSIWLGVLFVLSSFTAGGTCLVYSSPCTPVTHLIYLLDNHATAVRNVRFLTEPEKYRRHLLHALFFWRFLCGHCVGIPLVLLMLASKMWIISDVSVGKKKKRWNGWVCVNLLGLWGRVLSGQINGQTWLTSFQGDNAWGVDIPWNLLGCPLC